MTELLGNKYADNPYFEDLSRHLEAGLNGTDDHEDVAIFGAE